MKPTHNSEWRSAWASKAYILFGSALVGALSGLVVVAYRTAISALENRREASLEAIRNSAPNFLIWMIVALAAGAVTAFLAKRSPLIKGSGIPQVKAFLMGKLPFDWKRELPFKFAGGTLALGAGLSMGREGPSIQLGALVGRAVDDLRPNKGFGQYFVTAGAAAGISAAFNAPLAGVLFCVEEIHKTFSPLMLTSALTASFCANAVMWLFFGDAAVFNLPLAQVLPLKFYLSTVVLIGVAAGVSGSIFNLGLLGFQKAYKRLIRKDTIRIALSFAAAAAISVYFAPITGGGSRIVDWLPGAGAAAGAICLLFAGKLAFTLFSYASGAPGGIFLPMLSLGALIGAAVHLALPEFGGSGNAYLENFILLGMAAFFVAVVRAPITGSVLITEMAGSPGHFPAFILVSVIAALVAELLGTKPIYDSLYEQLVPPEPDAAGDPIHRAGNPQTGQ